MANYNHLLIGVALAAIGSGVFAQTAPQEIEARQRADVSARPQPFSGPEIQFTSQRPPSNSDEIRFQLNDVVISGGTAFSEEAMRALIENDLGSEVALTRVYELAGEIQGLYRDADYIFTRVVIPAQEIDGGVVRIEIIEAIITAVVIEEPDGEIGPVKELAEEMVAPIVNLRNPTGSMLERTLLNVNEIPGITRATAIPQADPDDARGGLQLFVNVEREAVEAVLFADNRQTEGIGRGLVGGTVTFNSYSKWGDTTSISVFNSFDVQRDQQGTGANATLDGAMDFDERNTIQVTHQRQLGLDGATVQAVGLYSRTRPGDELFDSGIEGEQFLVGLEASYPVLRTRQYELSGSIGAEFFESTTDISNGQLNVADDRLRVVYASLDGIRRDEFGYTRANVSVRKGFDALNASDRNVDNRSRDDGEVDFTLIRADLDRLFVINDDLSFLGRVGGQYSFDPLLASEEFSIGGLTYGRGFDPSIFVGDHGVGVSGELRYLKPLVIEGYPITLEAFGFAEYGVIWNKGDGAPQMAEIASLGGGLRLFFPENYALGFELAFPVDAETDDPNDAFVDTIDLGEPRLYVNFSKRF